MTRPNSPFSSLFALSLVLVAACEERPTPHDATVAPRDVPIAPRLVVDVPVVTDVYVVTRPPIDRIMAATTSAPVRREPRRDAPLEGYLRSGAVVEVEEGPLGREGCIVRQGISHGGWYRLKGGGYVCVGGIFAEPFPTRSRAPAQPDLDAAMPYRYAISYGKAMMYRRLPTMDDLRQFEPWRFARPTADGGGDMDASVTASVEDRPAPTVTAVVRDAGRPRLEDLEGENGGPVIRRMLTGMYVALDRTIRDSETGERYWHTQSGGFIRDGRLSVVDDAPTFQGVTLDAEHALPMAWMVSETGSSYTINPEGTMITSPRRVPRLTGVTLLDAPPVTVRTRNYYRTTDGHAVFVPNVRRASVRTPPEGVGPGERWIDVDLDEQVLVAYEGARPVYASLVSSGRKTSRGAPERFETPSGSFRIQSKHITTTMDGDTATDGPYSIEDVPWVMYFQNSYALHAAFWHNYFGWRMSHGCVNLSPPDARWFFLWTEPQMPTGWHAVMASERRPGTRIELRHSREGRPSEEGRPAGAGQAVVQPPAR